MPLYPYCVISDVEALNLHRTSAGTYGASSKPTTTQVKNYINNRASEIRGVLEASDYDVDNIHENSIVSSDAETAGDNVEIGTASTTTEFSVGDLVKIEGYLTSAKVKKHEFAIVTVVASGAITVDTLANGYDAAANIYLINDALRMLRDINAVGAAADAEEAAFMGQEPNASPHAETLRKLYENWLKRIAETPGLLRGATILGTAKTKASASSVISFATENTDDAPDPTVEIGMDL